MTLEIAWLLFPLHILSKNSPNVQLLPGFRQRKMRRLITKYLILVFVLKLVLADEEFQLVQGKHHAKLGQKQGKVCKIFLNILLNQFLNMNLHFSANLQHCHVSF